MQKNNSLSTVLMVVAVIAAGGFFAYQKFKSSPANAIEQTYAKAALPVTNVPTTPRTTQPFDEYTKFFTRKTYRVTGAGVEFSAPDRNVQYDLPYWWFQPAGAPYPTGLKFPLVLVLHGGHGNAYAGKYLIQQKMQVEYPAFIMAPVLPQGWLWLNPREIPGHPEIRLAPRIPQGLPGTVRLIKSLMAEYPIDPARIYVMGCSEGGMGAFGAVRDYSDLFAAAIPMSGVWNVNDAPKMTKMPVWVMQGAVDSVVPADVPRMLSVAIRKQGGNAAYTEIPGMDHPCPADFLYGASTWKWLFSQAKR